MNILVISDLHIGTKARATDLCPYPERTSKDKNLVSSFIHKANEFQSKNGVFDYIVIPGDITNQSNVIEYVCGDAFIKRLIKELSVSEDRIIFVPGNHDVDWSVLEGINIKPEEKVYRHDHKYNTLKDIRHRFSGYSNPLLLEPPFIKRWEFTDVIFVGFNSSWHDGSFEEKHYGLIQMEHIIHLREIFEKIDRSKIKIFVVHHHLHQFLNPHPTWRDISIMQNAQPLLELLTEFEFEFVIHGHRHVPNFISTSINGSKPINILCAGSYCCEVPSEISGHVGNLFHALQIDDKKKCKGKIISWAYDTRKGWVESTGHDGMEHENPFGSELELSSLISESVKTIGTKLQNGLCWIYFSELSSEIPDLKYLQLNLQKKMFEKLESDYKIKKTVDSGNRVILIKI